MLKRKSKTLSTESLRARAERTKRICHKARHWPRRSPKRRLRAMFQLQTRPRSKRQIRWKKIM